MRIKKYLLDGYVCGEKKIIKVKGKEYLIQKYQGEHRKEYWISEKEQGKMKGRCDLFENGIFSLSWIMKDDQQIERITEYEKGKAVFKEGWKSIFGKGDHRMIENSKEGLKLVIRDKNSTMIYQGEFDEELNRHGKGIEYDVNGELNYEGYWNKDELVKIVREFEEDEMIEYEDCDNADVLNRIPLYIGGYNIVGGEFKRSGIGYLIDRENGTAIRESEWFNGKELSGIDLFDGWYVDGMYESIRCVLNNEQPEEMMEVITAKKIEIHNTVEWNRMEKNVTDLVIGSDCCNDLTSLNLSGYKQLRVIKIGGNCFENVNTFVIDRLDNLKYIKIGANSFTHKKCDNKPNTNNCGGPGLFSNSNRGGFGINSGFSDTPMKSSRSFHISNCNRLKSLEIGVLSFSDYSGFELKNLPKLLTIKIGEIGRESHIFCSSSFEVKGIIDVVIANE